LLIFSKVPYKIHPSKCTKQKVEDELPYQFETICHSNSNSNSPASQNVISDDEAPHGTAKEKVSTDLAVMIHSRANLSLSQTITVLNILNERLGDARLQPPTRSALLKASKKHFEANNSICGGTQPLHFDGKCFKNLYGKEKVEIIAICNGEKLLAFKEVENKKAATVYNALIQTLTKHDYHPTTVVSDTEATNTGRNNGVIARLKRNFPNLQYQPCRMHVLDLILKHEFSARFPEKSVSSNIHYLFVEEYQKNWVSFRTEYLEACSNEEAAAYSDLPPTESRRRDYQLLLKLVKSLRFYRKYSRKPFIKNFPNQPPSTSNARWNSRAIFSLFAELAGNQNPNILSINTFIIDVCVISIYFEKYSNYNFFL